MYDRWQRTREMGIQDKVHGLRADSFPPTWACHKLVSGAENSTTGGSIKGPNFQQWRRKLVPWLQSFCRRIACNCNNKNKMKPSSSFHKRVLEQFTAMAMTTRIHDHRKKHPSYLKFQRKPLSKAKPAVFLKT